MQRVLETARKLGLPVVVTDPAGREPYVLLPLEQFEAMAGESKVAVGAQFIAPETNIPLNVAKNKINDIPMEDRFYLEPIDESAS